MAAQELIWKLLIAQISSAGFAMIFNLRGRWILPASLGGLFSWGIYLLCQHVMGPIIFTPCLSASVFSAIYSYTLARLGKAPFTMFFIISVVPLIPGSGLYRTIFALVQGNGVSSRYWGWITAEYALAIAFGFGMVWAGLEIYNRLHERRKHRAIS